MNEKEISEALKKIEKECKYSEVGDGRIEYYIDTNKFYERVKGLMELLNSKEK